MALALTVVAGGAGHAAGQSQSQSRAGVVVQFADGGVRTYCVAFDGDGITGMDLLLKTGLQVKVQDYGGMGGEVCKIGSDGCDYPGQPCACQSYGPGGKYWSYHHLRDGVWKSAVTGAGGYTVHNGEVDGWAWSDGLPPSSAPSFSQLCAPASPTPTAARLGALPTSPVAATATREAPAAEPSPGPTATSTAQPGQAASGGETARNVIAGAGIAVLAGAAVWVGLAAYRRASKGRR